MKYLTLKSFSILFVMCAVLFSACINPTSLSLGDSNDGMGTVRVSIGGDSNARTLLPTQLENFAGLYYIITFTHDDFDTVTRRLGILENATTTSVDLELGAWNMDIRGYVTNPGANPDADDALVYDTQTINVIPRGLSINADLKLNEDAMTLTDDGEGTLLYNITLPIGATGRLEIFRVRIQNGALIQDDEPVLKIDKLESTNEGELDSLPSGFYNIYVSVELNDRGAYWRELAHIYDGAVTVAEREFDESEINLRLEGIINSFTLVGIGAGDIVHEENNNNIYFNVPGNTNLTNLVPQITHNGVLVRPAHSTGINFSDPTTTTTPVEFTVLTTNGDENTYTVHVVIRSSLIIRLSEANALIENTKVAYDRSEVPRGDHWVTPSEMEALEDARDVATAYLVENNSRLTQAQINTAWNNLYAATGAFRKAFEQNLVGTMPPTMDALDASITAGIAAKAANGGVRQNSFAANVATGAKWVTDEEMAALNEVLFDAIARRDDLYDTGTQTQVDAIVTALNAAVDDFEAAKKDGTAPETGNGAITPDQRVIRITGLPSDGYAMAGVYPPELINNAPDGNLSMPEMMNAFASIQQDPILIQDTPNIPNNKELTLAMFLSGDDDPNPPWEIEGDGSYYIGLLILTDNGNTIWMSLETHNFDDDPYPNIVFTGNFRQMPLPTSITIGELIKSHNNGNYDGGTFNNHLLMNYGTTQVTMEMLLSGWGRPSSMQNNEWFLTWESLMRFLQDEENIQIGSDANFTPLERDHIIKEDDEIHFDKDFMITADYDTGTSSNRNVVGLISGTVNLTDIPHGAILSVRANTNGIPSLNFHNYSGHRIFGLDENTSDTNITWTALIQPAQELNAISISKEATYSVSFTINVQLPDGSTYPIDAGTYNITFEDGEAFEDDPEKPDAGRLFQSVEIVDLGNISLSSSTLNGTINISIEGASAPWLRVEVYPRNGAAMGSYYRIGYTNVPSGVNSWSIHIPPSLSGEVEFQVIAYPDANMNDNTRLFQHIFTQAYTVTDGKVESPINLVQNFVTISGSFNVINNSIPIQRFQLTANSSSSGQRLGSTPYLSSQSSQWSMIIPAPFTENSIRLTVNGYYGDVPQHGNWDNNPMFRFNVTRGIQNLTVEHIDINLVTLSGTIDIGYNNAPVTRLAISANDNSSNPISGRAVITPTGTTNIHWEILLPYTAEERDIYLTVTGYPSEDTNAWLNRLFEIQYPVIKLTLDENRTIDRLENIGNIMPNTLTVLDLPDGTYSIIIAEYISGSQYNEVYRINNEAGPVFNLEPGIFNTNSQQYNSYRVTITGDNIAKIGGIHQPSASGAVFLNWDSMTPTIIDP